MDIDPATLRALEQERGISMDVLVPALEKAMLSAYERTDGHHRHARAELNRKTGHVTIWAQEEFEIPESELPPEPEPEEGEEPRPRRPQVGQLAVHERHPDEQGPAQIGLVQVAVMEGGGAQERPAQGGARHADVVEDRVAQVAVRQVRFVEVAAFEAATSKVRAGQVGADEAQAAHGLAAQAGLAAQDLQFGDALDDVAHIRRGSRKLMQGGLASGSSTRARGPVFSGHAPPPGCRRGDRRHPARPARARRPDR